VLLAGLAVQPLVWHHFEKAPYGGYTYLDKGHHVCYKKYNFGGAVITQSFNRMVAILVLISSLRLACSMTLPNVSVSTPGFRFDVLPNKANESSTIAQYRAISAWDKTDLTYAFVNGTDQLPGDTEREDIRRAYDLCAAQTP
jgi:hypothetical protein